MKYRKKPVVIEAIKWDGKNINEIMNFMHRKNAIYEEHDGLFIHTLEGIHKALVGDMIIKGIHGEFYPCKPDIFELTYEVVKE